MKVLMAQQGFDKPFTGGLGSYKLYVLVAYHVSYFTFDSFVVVAQTEQLVLIIIFVHSLTGNATYTG